MTVLGQTTASAFLRRAGLLTALLALIAGIFGMHVMTATHAMHASATASVPASAQDGSQYDPAAATAQCTESDDCTSMQSMSGSCIPSAKTGSLDAPLPGTVIIAWNTNSGHPSAMGTRWSYLPGSPSPGELSISRT